MSITGKHVSTVAFDGPYTLDVFSHFILFYKVIGSRESNFCADTVRLFNTVNWLMLTM